MKHPTAHVESPSPPASTFPLFPSLPAELRQQIWLAALHQYLSPPSTDILRPPILSDSLATYRPTLTLLHHERRNRAALYTYKPGLWIPEFLPKGHPDYHPENHINLRFRYDLLDDAHFTSSGGGGGCVAALLRTCHESRATVLRGGVLGEHGIEVRDAVCDLAYHHGSRDWFELGVVDRVAMDVDDVGEKRMREVWTRMGAGIEKEIRGGGGSGGGNAAGEGGGMMEEGEARFDYNGQGYKAALVKMKQYHCHLGMEPSACHCQSHATREPGDLSIVSIRIIDQDDTRVSENPRAVQEPLGPSRILARTFNPEADLLFVPACAYHMLMIERPERGFFADLIERGMSTGGSLDGVKHIALSETVFRGVKAVDTVAFVQTFSQLESLSILVDMYVDRKKSTTSPHRVNSLEGTAMSNAWRGRPGCTGLTPDGQERDRQESIDLPSTQTCISRRRQRWEVETLAVISGKTRRDYSYPDNSAELCNETIAEHLFAQRHHITDLGYQPPVWQASHQMEGLDVLFHDLGVELTGGIEMFILEATQLINFEVRIARPVRT